MTPLLWSGCDMAAVDQVMEDETPMMTPGGTTPPLPEPAGTLVTTPEGGTMRGGSMMNAGVDIAGNESAGVEPAGAELSGAELAGAELAGSEPAGAETAGVEPAGVEPAGEEISPVCEPGEPVGLCVICDDQGDLIAAESDPECPGLECPQERFALDTQGQCVRQSLSGGAEGLCEDIGVCASVDTQECQVVEVEVVASGGSCQEVISCEGDEAPQVNDLPNGALCNEWGVCQDGECSAPSGCAAFERYNNRNFFCGAATTETGEVVCGFYVSGYGANNNSRITCNEFCQRSGSVCIDGWNNANDRNCNEGNGERGCDVSYETQICICTAFE